MRIYSFLYTLNYNPEHDCWWVDWRFGPKTTDDPQYVSVPGLTEYPVKRCLAVYDGKLRASYTVYKGGGWVRAVEDRKYHNAHHHPYNSQFVPCDPPFEVPPCTS